MYFRNLNAQMECSMSFVHLHRLVQYFRKHTQVECPWKYVSMNKNYHNHTLETNLRHREEKPQNTNSHRTPGINLSKTISSLLLVKMIAKLERTLSLLFTVLCPGARHFIRCLVLVQPRKLNNC